MPPERPYVIKDLFNKGLRNDSRNTLDMGAASVFKMIEPLQWGSREYVAVTALIGSSELSAESITIAHPFPMVFKGKSDTLLLTATNLWTVDEATGLLTAVTTYDPATPASTKAITGSSVWQFADFHDSWFLYNGTSVVFKSKYVDSTKVFTEDDFIINTGCNYKGRSLIGGFGTSTDLNDAEFWPFRFQNLFRYISNLEGHLTPSDWPWLGTPPTNSVVTSSIGIADMPLMLMFPNEFYSTETTSRNAMSQAGGSIAPTAGTETVSFITVDTNENIIKALTSDTSPLTELIKMTKEGVQIWRKDIESDFSTSVTGLVTDASDNIFVSSDTTDKVFKYDTDGTLLTSFGTGGTGNGQFDVPAGMDIDTNGKLHVCDKLNDRIQIWTTAGVWESDYGSTGAGDTQLDTPIEIQLDEFNNRYINDSVNTRFIKWDSANAFIVKVAYSGTHTGLTFDNIGHIYVGKLTTTLLKFDLNWNILETVTATESMEDIAFNYESGILFISANTGLDIQLYGVAVDGILPHLFERNEMSVIPMDYQGKVMNLLPLQTHVMCYGTEGVCALTDHEKIGGNFGLEEGILKIGLASRGAAGGSLNRHVFVDIVGTLWTIDTNLALTKLGYQEFFVAMIGNEITVSYDSDDDIYYVSDNAICYSVSGLPNNPRVAECPQLVTSAFQTQGAFAGIFEAATSPTGLDVKSGIIDFGYRDVKSVSWVEVDATDVTSMTLDVSYKYDSKSAFRVETGIKASPEGEFYVGISAREYIFNLKGTITSGARINRMSVMYDYVDNATNRGPRVAEGFIS